MPELDPRIQYVLVALGAVKGEKAWSGAPTHLGVLRGVRAKTALRRPKPDMGCIRDVALHIAFWENSVANKLLGESERVPFAQRKTGSPQPVKALSETQWKDELAYVGATRGRLARAVREFDPRHLDRPVSSKVRRQAIDMMHDAVEHSVYHTAQIKMLKALAS